MLPRLLIKFLIDLFIVNSPYPQSTVALTYPAFPSATPKPKSFPGVSGCPFCPHLSLCSHSHFYLNV